MAKRKYSEHKKKKEDGPLKKTKRYFRSKQKEV